MKGEDRLMECGPWEHGNVSLTGRETQPKLFLLWGEVKGLRRVVPPGLVATEDEMPQVQHQEGAPEGS